MRYRDTATLLLITLPAPALAAEAATVAVVEGDAFAQRGQVVFTGPGPGARLKLDQFGQYRPGEPPPGTVQRMEANVDLTPNTRRHLKTNDTVDAGEIVQTGASGWIKLIFRDDSVVDIGPGSLARLERAGEPGGTRLQLVIGAIHGVFPQAPSAVAAAQVMTPMTRVTVQGGEILAAAGEAENRVVCLHGRAAVDVVRYTEKGLVYAHPVVVNPGVSFTLAGPLAGPNALADTALLKPLRQQELRAEVASLSPAVNARATAMATVPALGRVPGTGVPLRYDPAGPRKKMAARRIASSFDSDHPPMEQGPVSPSGNFRDGQLTYVPGAFGNVTSLSRFTGPAPINQLPAALSRVKVNLDF